MNTLKILGVTITNEKKEKILEYFFDRIKSSKEKTFIITPNPEMLIYASKHLAYKSKLNSSTIALPDGIGLFFASGMMRKSLKERITGVDFIEDICLSCKNKPLSMGFLGAKSGVAKRTAECLQSRYPWINVVFAAEDWGKNGFLNGNVTTIDILFVAFGVPKQEEWIYEHLQELPVKAMMGVGGSFDYISGDVHRAPFIVRYAGLEWLFRLIVQPWRWKRQLALVEFVTLVFKENFLKTA